MSDVTVLISTYNRSKPLKITLEAMTRVSRGSLSVAFVVVNNGSTDDTNKVVQSFQGRLPLTLLNEPAPGRAYALNKALDTVPLGRIIVFADDDITPDPDWLEQMPEVCKRWPNHSVFGGQIDPVWPEGQQPKPWALHDDVQEFAFSRHVISDKECVYPPNKEPFGPNYFLLRDALGNTRFLPGLGPRPRNWKIGGETQFLRQLRKRGLIPVFTPKVRVDHRVEPQRLTERAMYRRALQLGRGVVYTSGLPDQQWFQRSRTVWKLRRAKNIAGNMLGLPWAAVSTDNYRRIRGIAERLVYIGTDLEALENTRGGVPAREPA